MQADLRLCCSDMAKNGVSYDVAKNTEDKDHSNHYRIIIACISWLRRLQIIDLAILTDRLES